MRFNLAVLPLLLFLASNAYAQICPQVPGSYIIRGRVIAPGERWDHYHEVLQFDESRLVGWAYTDSTGQFSLPGIGGGHYYIVVKIDGFKESRERILAEGCSGIVDHFAYLDFDDEVIRPVVLDFTGEVNETVDVAELKQAFPKKAVEEFERSRQERLRGEAKEARTRLEKLVKQYPDFYDARNALGSVYLEMKRYREAETQYNEARRLKPTSAAPFVSLGSLYVQEAEASLNPEPGIAGIVVPGVDLEVILSDAREVLTHALKIKPDASFAHYLMGIVEARTGHYQKAEENLRKALEIEPKLRWSRLALGNLFIKQGKLKEALAEIDTYLADYKNVSNRPDVEGVRARIALHLAKETK
jgi:tetratricopeptide (TPR) repeat protein